MTTLERLHRQLKKQRRALGFDEREVLATYNSGDPIKDTRAMLRDSRRLFGKELRDVRAMYNSGDPIKDAQAMLRESRALCREFERKTRSWPRTKRRRSTSPSGARSRRSR